VSLGKADSTKAMPEVSAVRALAIGHVESISDMHIENDAPPTRSGSETPVSAQTHVLAKPVPSATLPFISTYEGQDPGILALLQDVHAATVRSNAPLAELGPHVSNYVPKRRMTTRKGPGHRPSASGREPTLLGSYNSHDKAIMSIVVSPDNLFYATASSDGVVNIWDIARLERSVSSKPRLTYTALSQKLHAACGIENSHCIALGTDDGFEILRVFSSVSNNHRRYLRTERMKRYQSRQDEGSVLCLQHLKMPDGASCMLYATNAAKVVLLDLRTMMPTLHLDLQPGMGLPTTVCVDRKRTWAAVTTSHGCICIFDLRFGLLLRTVSAEGFITTSNIHPTEGHDRWLMVGVDLSRATLSASAASVPERVFIQTFDVSTGELVQVVGAGDIGSRQHHAGGAHPPSRPADAIANLIAEEAARTADEAVVRSEDGQERHEAVQSAIVTTLFPAPLLGGMDEIKVQHPVEGAMAGASWLVTGGEDRLVRAWQLNDFRESYVLTGASRGSEVAYRQVPTGRTWLGTRSLTFASIQAPRGRTALRVCAGIFAGIDQDLQLQVPRFPAIGRRADAGWQHKAGAPASL
jgi:phosphoinositide-3-kinase regulatory subunit 4